MTIHKPFQILLIGGLLLLGATGWTSAAQGQTKEIAPVGEKALAPVAPAAVAQTFETMMGAIEDNNRAAFIAFGDAPFKAAITPPLFQSVVDQLGFRLKAGHQFLYLGELKKSGAVVYLWRVRFDDDGNDSLAEMSMKDGKVGGFLLR